MTIPLATTTIEVRRTSAADTQDPLGDGYDTDYTDADTRTSRGIRAVISLDTGRGQPLPVGGQAQAVTFRLVCDPVDLDYRDEVVDEATGQRYEVLWTFDTPGIAGLDHTRAGLRTVAGAA